MAWKAANSMVAALPCAWLKNALAAVEAVVIAAVRIADLQIPLRPPTGAAALAAVDIAPMAAVPQAVDTVAAKAAAAADTVAAKAAAVDTVRTRAAPVVPQDAADL